MKKFYVIIVAAGQGTRFGSDTPKQYVTVSGKPLLRHTLNVFAGYKGCAGIMVVISDAHRELYQNAVRGLTLLPPVLGGISRKESVYNGLRSLESLAQADDVILIHDAARPLIAAADIAAVLTALEKSDAATLAMPVADTLRYADVDGSAGASVSRDALWSVQTPQGFKFNAILKAHQMAGADINYTDDTGLASAVGMTVKFVKSSAPNFKVTTKEDLLLAENLLSKNLSTETRTGTGYDVHAFDDAARDVKSIRLCGVDVPFDRKLSGHSDADVGLHALTDAILGAIGEGDIGLHFPPSNMDFKDMDSAIFLKHAVDLMRRKGGRLFNADITLICEKPKLGAHRDLMRVRVAEILGCSATRVNIKATTTEKLGFTGRMEGIAAQASASVSMPAQED
jgi:2-C-methyl-D-erythritol 4-phosphate cytidylyltransferase / 2-C-methyl-D-erythritol 2,4-cyclodiphosphate synthase